VPATHDAGALGAGQTRGACFGAGRGSGTGAVVGREAMLAVGSGAGSGADTGFSGVAGGLPQARMAIESESARCMD